jgi:uncharacterized membrane protein
VAERLRAASWPRWGNGARPAVLALLAVLVLAGSWALIHVGGYARDDDLIRDTPLYQQYGEAMAAGKLPYRDFVLEYPPGALPVFVLPALGRGPQSEERYRRRFELVLFACAAAALAAMAAVLAALGAHPLHVASALAFAALAPLALGQLILTRFDLWPAALAVTALACLLWRRTSFGFAVLALAVAAKLYAAVLLPLALAFVWHREGRRRAAVSAGLFLAVLAACVVPFVLLSREGLWLSFKWQLERPLQVESLGASLLIAAHHLFGLGLAVEFGYGSHNLAGTAADALVDVQSALLAAALLAIWIRFARRPRSSHALVAAAAAAVCAFVALGKVFSPQFLIWLVPLVPLVRGRRGLAASTILAAALVLTRGWFPYHYFDYVEFETSVWALVVARNVELLALVVLLVARPQKERDATAAAGRSARGVGESGLEAPPPRRRSPARG